MNHTKQKVLNYEGLNYFYNRLKEDLAPSKLVDQIDHLNATVAEIDTDITNLQSNKVDKVSGKGLSTNDYTTIEKVKLGATNIAYATCSTAAGTAAKVATVVGNTNWTLSAGSTISILFSNTNTAQNPTLNVNGTGAKNIYYENAQITTSNLGYAGTTKRVMTFVYDGTQYHFSAWGYDGNTNTYVRTYKDESGTYPLLASRSAIDKWTSTYLAVYGEVASNISMTPSTGTITATNFNGLAAKATADADGNIIKSTYATQNALSTHNQNTSAHSDIRTLITNLSTRLNTLADSDDTTLDQLSEIVAYIKNNKGLIEGVTTNKQDKITGAATTLVSSDLTKNRALIANGSGKVAISSVTSTELEYLGGVTSKIQDQLNSKASTAVASTTASGLMSSSDKTKLNNIEDGANNYSLPTASSTLGGVKTTSTVTSTSGLTACPIIDGVPYYKNNTYTVNNGTITLSAGAGLTGGGDFTLNQSSAETISFAHSNNVTAGTVSEGGSARTLAFGGTFKVPSVTYDAQGHITGTTTTTLTMPAAPTVNDKKVLQSSSTTSDFRPLIFGATRTTDLSTITTEVTDQVFINEKFYAKPSEGRLFAKSITLTGEAVSNVQFTREGLSYILAPTTGSIGIGCMDTVKADACTMTIDSGYIRPGSTNTICLGSDTKRWKSIFTTELNASGTVRLSRSEQWPTLNIYRTEQGDTPSATIAYEGSNTNTTSRIRFRIFSKNSTDNMLLGSSLYEDYALPSADTDRTGTATYAILTTKSPVTIAQGGTGGNSREVAWNNIVAAGGTFTGPITGTLNGNATSSSKTSLVEKEAANWTSFTWFGAKDTALSTSQHIGQANFLAVEGSGKRVNRFQFFSRSWDSTTGDLLEYGRYAIIPSCPTDLTATKYEYFILGDSSKNIDVGNITAKSLTLTSGISIENGGTGAVSAKAARVNLLVNGTNPITSPEQDLVTYWGSLGGISVSYFNKADQITEQPSQYGLLLNCSYQTNSSISFQIWGTTTGTMYCRGSSTSGLSSWSKVLTEDNFASVVSLSSLKGVSYTEVADLNSLL